MHSLESYFLFSIIPCILASAATQVHPVVRSVTSNASCIDGYQWMDNAQSYSPCLTVAYVEAACTGDTYLQPTLEVGYNYALPNSSTAGPCYCSWSSYNLMMACTLCQGSQFSHSLWQWPQWVNGCSTNPSWAENYFPSGYVLAGDASIPYWATLNPANWTYETFDIEQANATYQQNPSNIYPGSTVTQSSSTSSSKSTDVGTIVGAVVGSAAALALLAVGAYLLYRRHVFKKGAHASAANRRGTVYLGGSSDAATNMTHSRLPSDTSTYYPLSPSQQYSAYSPQHQTVHPSVQGSFSPPPPTVTSVYTTRSNQPSNAMPLV